MGPEGRDYDYFGTRGDEFTEGFGECEIPADEHANGSEGCGKCGVGGGS